MTFKDASRAAVLAVLAGALVLLTAELTARIEDRLFNDVPLAAAPSFEDLFVRDELGRHGRANGRFRKWQLNEFGLRAPAMSLAPPPGCTRIVVMGASETFGLYESPDHEYPALLGRALASAHPARCIEVVNTAVAGMTLGTMADYWKNLVARFEPDLVVLYPSPHFYLGARQPQLAPAEATRTMQASAIPAPALPGGARPSAGSTAGALDDGRQIAASAPGAQSPALATSAPGNSVSQPSVPIVAAGAAPAPASATDASVQPAPTRVAGTPLKLQSRFLARLRDVINIPRPLQMWRDQRTVAAAVADQPPGWVFTEPPPERLTWFEQDLTQLVQVIQAQGVQVTLLTHATRATLPPRREDLPDLWTARSFTPRAALEVIVEFDRAANQVTGKVARASGSQLIDTAATLNGCRECFGDLAHFTDLGASRFAAQVARELVLPPH